MNAGQQHEAGGHGETDGAAADGGDGACLQPPAEERQDQKACQGQ